MLTVMTDELCRWPEATFQYFIWILECSNNFISKF